MTTPGRIAFEAYSRAMQGLTHDGQPIPSWANLTDEIRAGWEAAALAATEWINPTEADNHLAHAAAYARELSAERPGQHRSPLTLAAAQGHALRLVIAHSAAALVAAMTEPSAVLEPVETPR